MIYFFSDSHFEKHCGAQLFERLPETLKSGIVFTENDWDILEKGEWEKEKVFAAYNWQKIIMISKR